MQQFMADIDNILSLGLSAVVSCVSLASVGASLLAQFPGK